MDRMSRYRSVWIGECIIVLKSDLFKYQINRIINIRFTNNVSFSTPCKVKISNIKCNSSMSVAKGTHIVDDTLSLTIHYQCIYFPYPILPCILAPVIVYKSFITLENRRQNVFRSFKFTFQTITKLKRREKDTTNICSTYCNTIQRKSLSNIYASYHPKI